MRNNIDRMYRLFGVSEDNRCRDCVNLQRVICSGGRMVHKCAVYGVSNSEASDWSSRNVACGNFGKPNAYKTPVMRWKMDDKEAPPFGQMELKL